MRVLLTGATGFVGSEVLEQLVGRGDEVCVLALPDTVDTLGHRDRIQVFAGSLSDRAALEDATRGVEVVYHLAAIHLSALRAVADPRDLKAVNVDGTDRLLRACAASAVRRIVFTSSVAVYNAAPWPFMWPIGETYPLRTTGEDNLRSYAQSKIDAETLVRRAHQEQGIEAMILRSPAVYGRGAPWVERMVRSLATNPWSAMTRLGRFACNQWIHRHDLARAVVLAGTAPEMRYELCNVSGPELFAASDILSVLSRLLRQAPPFPISGRDADRTARYGFRYDVTRAQTRLGFAPKVKLEAGIAEVLAAMTPAPQIASLRRHEQSSVSAEVELF
jgi:nucleoside-diphosphate-sugar epimerase